MRTVRLQLDVVRLRRRRLLRLLLLVLPALLLLAALLLGAALALQRVVLQLSHQLLSLRHGERLLNAVRRERALHELAQQLRVRAALVPRRAQLRVRVVRVVHDRHEGARITRQVSVAEADALHEGQRVVPPVHLHLHRHHLAAVALGDLRQRLGQRVRRGAAREGEHLGQRGAHGGRHALAQLRALLVHLRETDDWRHGRPRHKVAHVDGGEGDLQVEVDVEVDAALLAALLVAVLVEVDQRKDGGRLRVRVNVVPLVHLRRLGRRERDTLREGSHTLHEVHHRLVVVLVVGHNDEHVLALGGDHRLTRGGKIANVRRQRPAALGRGSRRRQHRNRRQQRRRGGTCEAHGRS
mmetsp:Transcript_24949/g.86922  ORF Transcript_24949/g.86922 Transcript_24949/m.86922 type:complete len:353 (-) Transcript_24949:68-1126(-)